MEPADSQKDCTGKGISRVVTPTKARIPGGREAAQDVSNDIKRGKLMLPETVRKRLETLGEVSRQGKRVNGLFRLLESQDMYLKAYANIYANKGATTKGIDGVTMDGFSEERVSNLIELLKERRYAPKPVRRVYVPKKNGKLRPLGVPSGDDKLVQEVARMLLERIYEPTFSHDSHGFRTGHSCHTALEHIRHNWNGVKWLIDVDIKGFYDNINHTKLIALLEKKIDDKRFIGLIKDMLKAGYMEAWTFHKTHSGTPQGGIVSPILANAYLHELDIFMQAMQRQYNKGKRREQLPEYGNITNHIYRLRKTQGKQATAHIKALEEQRRNLPEGDPFDADFRRLYYCRYADDVLIGTIGSKQEAEEILLEVKAFLQEHLDLHTAEDKTTLKHATEGTIFLGYKVQSRTGERVVKTKNAWGTYYRARSYRQQITLLVPEGKAAEFCHKKGYGNYQALEAAGKAQWRFRSDVEIVLAYNAELRGLANYYSLATNVKTALHKLGYIEWLSLMKTLAGKHQTSVAAMALRLRQSRNEYVCTHVTNGKTYSARIYQLKHLKKTPKSWQDVDTLPQIVWLSAARTEITQRLSAEQCEYCGTEKGYFEVHHVRKLKDVQGRELWERVMIAMQRKTIVLCVECHDLLHRGKLPDWRRKQA
jgi:group II intron reverse transcriptase/maturase